MRLLPAGESLARAALIALPLAAVELLCGSLIAGVIAPDRAEALGAILLRPWLALLIALIVARWRPRERIAAYLLFLGGAGAAEALHVRLLGNADPWTEMARGWAAGALLLVVIDLLFQLARRRLGRAGLAASAGAVGILLLAIPALLEPYRAIANQAERGRQTAIRPPLLLMTALPIVWGEGGAFDPDSRPAGSYRLLQEEYAVQPVDTLDPRSLAPAKLLLLAQPRWLAPSELVALDRWVRAGGRMLILTDPLLEWPSALPLGDVRRAPPVGLLKPLLDHWGVTLEPSPEAVVTTKADGRLLTMRRPGRFVVVGSECRATRTYLASCRIGLGRAILLADADLMRDDLWIAPGERGDSRSRRWSDNPLVIADLLDRLAELERPRARNAVAWIAVGAGRRKALGLALLPLVLVAAAVSASRLHRRRAAR